MDVQQLARFKSIQCFERRERENVPENVPGNVPEETPEETPEQKKFNCEFAEEVKERGAYSMNCLYFGCIHIIDDDCEALKELKKWI